MATYTAKVTFYADTKALKKGFTDAKRGLKGVGSFVQKNSRMFLGAATAGAAAFGGLVAQGVAYGTTIDRMAEATGVAHEEISRLTYASELYHGSAQDVEKAVKRLSKAMYDAGVRDLATYQDAFDELGIRIKNADGTLRSTVDVFMDFADAAAASTDATALLGGAQDLLGRSVMNLLPLMKQGSGAIREAFEESDRLGNTIDANLSKQLEELGTNMKRLKLAGRGVGAALAKELAPAVDELVEKVLDAVEQFQNLSPEMKKFTVAAGGGTIAAVGLGGILGLMWPMLQSVAAALAGVGLALSPLAAAIAAAGSQVFGFNWLLGGMKGALEEGDTAAARFKAAQAGLVATMLGGVPGFISWRDQVKGAVADLEAAKLAAMAARGELSLWPGAIGPMPGGAGGPGGGDGAIDDEAAAAAQAYADACAAAAVEAAALEAPILRVGGATFELGSATAGIIGQYEALTPFIEGVTSAAEAQLPAIEALQWGWEDLIAYFSDIAAPSFAQYIDTLGAAMSGFSKEKLKWFDEVKKGTKTFLADILKMLARQAALEMAITVSAETGKATMKAQWWQLPIIAAGYAAAVAGINAAAGSFDVGAKVQRGGAFTGYLHAGERIVNLRDFKQLVAAGSGGGRGDINVYVQMDGTVMGTSDADYEFQRLADFIARRIDRE